MEPWFGIEKIFLKKIFLFSAIGAVFFILLGVVGYYQKGFPERLSANQQALFTVNVDSGKLFNHELGCFLLPDQDKNQFKSCTFMSTGKGSVLLWGDSRQLKNTIEQLHKIGIKDIVVVGPAPIWDDTLPHIMARFNVPFSELPKRLNSHVSKDVFLLDHQMQSAAEQWNVKYISLLSVLCNQDGCLTRIGKTPDQLINFDDEHFTQSGSKYVVSTSIS